ncbi:reverse transcriptase domain, reverse transcriptase zinc-binding domain protein [Tanacetum coccineum]
MLLELIYKLQLVKNKLHEEEDSRPSGASHASITTLDLLIQQLIVITPPAQTKVEFKIQINGMWSELEPIAGLISPRDISRAGLTLQSKVNDILNHGCGAKITMVILKLSRYPKSGSDIRVRNTKVEWYSMVWFPSCIPRHAINLWLIVRKKLKTQDLIPVWNISDSLGVVCSLCETTPDSHDHLFFECPFVQRIWIRIKCLAGLDSSNPNIYDIIQDLLPIVKCRTSSSVIAKLVLCCDSVIMGEAKQNWRLFQKGKRTTDQIVECIISSVRLKLLSCKLKKSKNGERMARLWDLPEAIFI